MNHTICGKFGLINRLAFAAIFWAAIFLGVQEVQSQETEKQLAGYFYKEVVLNADASAKDLPVVIGLHWSGSTPDEFGKYLTGFTKPVRLILVRAPYPHKSGFSFYSRQPKNYYELPADEKMQVLLDEGEKLSKFIEEISANYRPKIKPVIIGASQGGDLSYVIGVRYNHLISLSCPLLATMDNRIVGRSTLAKPAPIEVFHGTADPIVSFETVKQHVEVLKKNGFKVKLHEYKDIKHDISEAMKTDYLKIISRVLF